MKRTTPLLLAAASGGALLWRRAARERHRGCLARLRDRCTENFVRVRDIFHALDASSGELLWRTSLGGQIANGPIAYAVEGVQYVAVAAGTTLLTYTLP